MLTDFHGWQIHSRLERTHKKKTIDCVEKNMHTHIHALGNTKLNRVIIIERISLIHRYNLILILVRFETNSKIKKNTISTAYLKCSTKFLHFGKI